MFPGSHAQELNGTHFLHVVSSTGILELNFHKICKKSPNFSHVNRYCHRLYSVDNLEGAMKPLDQLFPIKAFS